MGLFRRAPGPEAFAAAMAGPKMGDRVLFAGTDDVALVAALATRAGLSGHTAAIAPDEATARARGAAAEQAGALVEMHAAPLSLLPLDAGTFDLVVAEDVLAELAEAERRSAIAEFARVLRPGGRLVWIERQPRGGLFALASDKRETADGATLEALLRDSGFRAARTLAAREGRVFVEATKPRD